MNNNRPLQTLKGFRDFLPEMARKRTYVIDMIKKVFELYGFEPLESPALEYESLLLGKYGQEADKLVYTFKDKGGRSVALRYDQTVPTARIIAQHNQQLPIPLKRYQNQLVWRADKPQKGRYREFLQCDADIIGSNSPTADAEILALYTAVYRVLGLENALTIKINDRAKLFNILKIIGFKKNELSLITQSLDKLDKKSKNDVIDELVNKGIAKSNAEKLLNHLESQKMSDTLQTIILQAEALGVKKSIFEYSPTLARGLDYYTGMIFEGLIEGYNGGSVGGGGRYDNLINDLVGIAYPSVGFGLGFDRTIEAIEQLKKLPLSLFHNQTILVTIFNEKLVECSLKLTTYLRNNKISAETYIDPRIKLDKQLKYANKKNIPYVIIIGPDEVKQNKVILKNMKSGDQKILSENQLINILSSKD